MRLINLSARVPVKLLNVLMMIQVLSGCAAVGVLPTSDPALKIRDANQLMAQGRGLRARQFATEALAMYQSNNDPGGVARAHSVLGDINRDATGPNLPNLAEAVGHYLKSAEIYETLNLPKWQAFNLYAAAGVQHLNGAGVDACAVLARSKRAYAKAPDSKVATEGFERAGVFTFESFPKLERLFHCETGTSRR